LEDGNLKIGRGSFTAEGTENTDKKWRVVRNENRNWKREKREEREGRKEKETKEIRNWAGRREG
jgi:hypothetical protein